MEKWTIGERFATAVGSAGFTLDISCAERDRIYGNKWIDFITSCKAMLGVESGASVIDFTGEIQASVESYLGRNPEASFEEVHAKYLEPYEGRISMNQISPRCFECAALKTPMVLFEGGYSGVLKPWRHFIPLRKDFVNIDEVVAAIRRPDELQAMAARAYEEIALNPNYSYRHLVEIFDRVVVAEHYARRCQTVMGNAYTNKEYQRILDRNARREERQNTRLMKIVRSISQTFYIIQVRGIRWTLRRVYMRVIKKRAVYFGWRSATIRVVNWAVRAIIVLLAPVWRYLPAGVRHSLKPRLKNMLRCCGVKYL